MALVLARYSALRSLEYFRVPKDVELRLNDLVVLKTRRGEELGQVKADPGDPKLGPRDTIAGEVLRRPSLEDSNKFREQREIDQRPVRRAFKELAGKHKLPMRFERAEMLLSGDRMVVYFTSDDRIDFRNFVRDLNEALDARIELRQVGARDAARLTGDVGVCGQELCCVSYIIDFVPVSMKMAKTQRISLDPAKISGQCGRLKCCLKYEDDLYNELRQTVPQEGQPVTCEGRDCHACGVDILRQKVTVDFGDGVREERDISEIEFEAGWSDKDIRRYRRDRRAQAKAEREARIAERAARADRRAQNRPESPDRRQGQDTVHPARRTADESAGESAGDSPAPPEAEQAAQTEAPAAAEGATSQDGAGPQGEGDKPKRRRGRRRRGRGKGKGGGESPQSSEG
jgi:cell fate regulator YaaT (PSP1 superfamily)